MKSPSSPFLRRVLVSLFATVACTASLTACGSQDASLKTTAQKLLRTIQTENNFASSPGEAVVSAVKKEVEAGTLKGVAIAIETSPTSYGVWLLDVNGQLADPSDVAERYTQLEFVKDGFEWLCVHLDATSEDMMFVEGRCPSWPKVTTPGS